MHVRDLREKYLAFFASKGHVQYPSGSLVPYDVTGRLDESLLFNGAGMIQFKPYFRGVAQPENRRLMTAQKCVRTGDIEEVGDDTHLTFFEMMGNFSFGDYFKSQAIAFSWEFLTSPEWLGLDPKRLAFTIYENDDEAYEEWARWLIPAGIDPETRIFRLDEETNYWPAGSFTKGPPGPCGPNSEMFFWTSEGPPPTGPYDREDFLRDDAENDWVEIWNDVFISYEWLGRLKNPSRPADGFAKDGMPELPFRSIDTGMGLERTAMVLSHKKSVYDTDVFQPILSRIRALSQVSGESAEAKIAERVVADHIRTSSFCIADGVLPSNNGRGYVLRRLIRRAVLKGQRVLGFDRPFFHEVFEGVVESMGVAYPELGERRDTIVETLRNEEAQFRRTLNSGSALLEQELAGVTDAVLPGDIAFRLYDTFGFPLEVTQEIAAESGVSVDLAGYEAAMQEAQERSRSGQEREAVYGAFGTGDELSVPDAPTATEFVGYEQTREEATIVRVKPAGEGTLLVNLDRTPFYAQSGGQVGDTGVLIHNGARLNVVETTKSAGLFWHEVETDVPAPALLGQAVEAVVDEPRRERIRRNHTATHLLHAALRRSLGTHVAQAGSYVGPDGLRFDVTHNKAMTPEELAHVEREVNEHALANTPVTTYVDIPIAEAKARGAMALFGEKYGNKVRMVEVGDYSRELCGGIHVRSTGEIGLFKILSESSAAGGIRRIEAITGEAAYEWMLDETRRMRDAAGLLKASPRDLVPAVSRVLDQVKEERRKREKAEVQAARGGGERTTEEIAIDGVLLWVKNFGELDQKIAASELDNAAAEKSNFIGIGAVSSEGKVNLFAKAGPEAVKKGANAGTLVREVAKIVGGGGGGRPDFATAGGKHPEKVDEALQAVEGILRAMLKS